MTRDTKDFEIGEGIRITFGNWKNSDEAERLVLGAMRSNWISGGSMVKRLEEEWGECFGCEYNVAMSSGTDADKAAALMLYNFGAQEGDEIIVPALAFVAVGNSIWSTRLNPVFVDINRETLNIDPDKIENAITDKTCAIMAVHTMGKPCDMDKIGNIAEKYNLKIIEDCCEAHGAKYKGRVVGSIGDIGTYSLYTAHIVTACGGGMCSTNDKEIYDILRSVKSHGRKPGELRFNHIRKGFNFRMGDLTAAVGIVELEQFDKNFEIRRGNLNYLLSSTRDLEKYAHFIKEASYETVSPHAFSVTLRDDALNGEKFETYLRRKGIDCKRNFGSMPTQHGAFESFGYKKGDFPEAEFVGDNGVHFGIHQCISKNDLDYCSDVLHGYFRSV